MLSLIAYCLAQCSAIQSSVIFNWNLKYVSLNPLCGHEPGTNNIDGLWDTDFYSGDPGVIMSCLICSTLSLWLWQRYAGSLARHWQTPLFGAMADNASL
jgi:hypothetical protein